MEDKQSLKSFKCNLKSNALGTGKKFDRKCFLLRQLLSKNKSNTRKEIISLKEKQFLNFLKATILRSKKHILSIFFSALLLKLIFLVIFLINFENPYHFLAHTSSWLIFCVEINYYIKWFYLYSFLNIILNKIITNA